MLTKQGPQMHAMHRQHVTQVLCPMLAVPQLPVAACASHCDQECSQIFNKLPGFVQNSPQCPQEHKLIAQVHNTQTLQNSYKARTQTTLRHFALLGNSKQIRIIGLLQKVHKLVLVQWDNAVL